jgi:hypothetical protein
MSTWRNPNPTPVQLRHREAQHKVNQVKREQYRVIPPLCGCGKTLLYCECPDLDAPKPQRKQVVMVLDLTTMTKKIEVR